MGSLPGGKKVSLTRSEEANIYALISPVLKKQDDGIWKYDEGWSDVGIFNAFMGVNPTSKANQNHITNYRIDVFGKIYNSPRKPNEERIDALEARVVALEATARLAIDTLTQIQSNNQKTDDAIMSALRTITKVDEGSASIVERINLLEEAITKPRPKS